jgi:hypothetical protein
VGPTLYQRLGAQGGADYGLGEQTSVGVATTIGGVFGGTGDAFHEDPSPVDRAVPTVYELTRPPVVEFGDAHQWVFLGGLGIGAGWTNYTGAGQSETSFTLSPSADYFFVDRVSIGMAVSVAASKASETQSGVTTAATALSYSAAPRIGWSVHVARRVSLFPTISFGVGHESETTSVKGASTTVSDTNTFLGGNLAILYDAANHLVVGGGPSFTTDLGRSLSNGVTQVRGTTVTFSLYTGGWM